MDRRGLCDYIIFRKMVVALAASAMPGCIGAGCVACVGDGAGVLSRCEGGVDRPS